MRCYRCNKAEHLTKEQEQDKLATAHCECEKKSQRSWFRCQLLSQSYITPCPSTYTINNSNFWLHWAFLLHWEGCLDALNNQCTELMMHMGFFKIGDIISLDPSLQSSLKNVIQDLDLTWLKWCMRRWATFSTLARLDGPKAHWCPHPLLHSPQSKSVSRRSMVRRSSSYIKLGRCTAWHAPNKEGDGGFKHCHNRFQLLETIEWNLGHGYAENKREVSHQLVVPYKFITLIQYHSIFSLLFISPFTPPATLPVLMPYWILPLP